VVTDPRLRSILSLLLLFSTLCWPEVARADDPAAEAAKKAKLHYQRGSEAYSVGRYAEAIKELEEAYRLSGESVLLYNIAKSYEKLGEYEEAVRHYRDYVDLTPTVSEEDRKEVERTIKELEEKRVAALPELTVRSTPEGATLYLDEKDKVAGTTPYKARIEPGQHKIYLEKKGFLPVEHPFKMPADEPHVVDLTLQQVIEYGKIRILSDVDGARVFVDGKNVGITPYREPVTVKVGKHQVYLEKPKFHRFLVVVEVAKDRTVMVNANMQAVEPRSKVPARLGWTGVIVGTITLAGAYVCSAWANGLMPWQPRPVFNDAELFLWLYNGEIWGYVGGGVLFAGGLSLLIYDGVREEPKADEAPPPPPPAPPAAFDVRSVAPLVVTF